MKVGVVVQRLEHRPVTAEVAGSNPVNLVIIFYFNSPTPFTKMHFSIKSVSRSGRGI